MSDAIEKVKYRKNADGDMVCRVNRKYHSIDDQPAVMYQSGGKLWYKHGVLHRDGDKPAAISSDGSQFWYKEGKMHRDGDEPAVIYCNGDK